MKQSTKRKIQCDVIGWRMAALFFCGVLSIQARGGDLNPPPGPIAPTMKTLVEVEPRIAVNEQNTPGDALAIFRITQPGSYYLTGNVVGVVGKNGIAIDAEGVTLDLNGFVVRGVGGSLNGVAGVPNSFSISNGTVRDWGQSGLFLGSNVLVSSIRAVSNGHRGISAGDGVVIESSVARLNGQEGIRIGGFSSISNCNALENQGHGFWVGTGSVVNNSVAQFNGNGGFRAEFNTSFLNCSASENGGNGFHLLFGGIAMNCTSLGSVQNGFRLGGGNNSLVSCVSRGSTQFGITSASAQGDMIVGCTVLGNNAGGIQVEARSVVRDCRASNNGGPGIEVFGSDSRIEGNTCTANQRGIRVANFGNFIARNICSGNTVHNWDIGANNTILVVVGTTSPAFTGDAGGESPGSTDPNANYSY